jgi:hypothetical protein
MVGGDESWILTSTETVLRCYVEMLRTFYPITKPMVPEVLAVFADCVCQHERETLVCPTDMEIHLRNEQRKICPIHRNVSTSLPFSKARFHTFSLFPLFLPRMCVQARISLRVLQDFMSLLEEHREEGELWDAYCLTLLGIVRKNLPDWVRSYQSLTHYRTQRILV